LFSSAQCCASESGGRSAKLTAALVHKLVLLRLIAIVQSDLSIVCMESRFPGKPFFSADFILFRSWYLLVFDLGSRGPSTVTLIALLYVATWGGEDPTIIVSVKLFPATIKTTRQTCYYSRPDSPRRVLNQAQKSLV